MRNLYGFDSFRLCDTLRCGSWLWRVSEMERIERRVYPSAQRRVADEGMRGAVRWKCTRFVISWRWHGRLISRAPQRSVT